MRCNNSNNYSRLFSCQPIWRVPINTVLWKNNQTCPNQSWKENLFKIYCHLISDVKEIIPWTFWFLMMNSSSFWNCTQEEQKEHSGSCFVKLWKDVFTWTNLKKILNQRTEVKNFRFSKEKKCFWFDFFEAAPQLLSSKSQVQSFIQR